MNRLINIGTPKDISEFQLGTINIIGGEEEMVQERINEEILERIPEKVSEITYEVKRIPTRILKELKAKVDYEISSHRLALRKLHVNETLKNKKAVSENEMVELAYEIEGFLSNKTFDAITAFDKRVYGKRNVITYLLAKRKNRVTHDVACIPTRLSMITQEAEYEVIKGENMNLENKVHIKEKIDEDTGEVTEDVFIENVSNKRTGKLKARDLMVLHQSAKLFMKVGEEADKRGNNRPIFKTTLELNGMDKFFEFYKDNKDEILVDIPNFGKRPLRHIRRISLEYGMSTNKLADGLITKYKGNRERFSSIKIWNEFEHEYDVPGALSYNYVDYSVNGIVIVGVKGEIRSVQESFEKLNSVENGYYQFDNIGLNGLTNEEKEVLKQFHRKNNIYEVKTEKGEIKVVTKRKESPFKNEEAEELLEICRELQEESEDSEPKTSSELESELRFELRDLKTRTSSELFFLINYIEEEAYTGDIPEDKLGILLSVLKEFKGQKEIFEEERDCLSFDIKDLVISEKTKGFKADRKHKNLYNQKLGLLKPHQVPYEMDFIVVNEEACKKELKYIRNRNMSLRRNVLDKHIEKYGMRTYIDKRGNETRIRRNMTILENECIGGSPCVSFQTSKKPKYGSVPEEEHHHSSSRVVFNRELPTPLTPEEIFGHLILDKLDLIESFERRTIDEIVWGKGDDAKDVAQINKGLSSSVKMNEGFVTRTVTGLDEVLRKMRGDYPPLKTLQLLGFSNKDKSIRYPAIYKENKKQFLTLLSSFLKGFKDVQNNPDELKDAFDLNQRKFAPVHKGWKLGEVIGVKDMVNNKILNINFEGNIDLLNEPTLSIVGTRTPSKETAKYINAVVKEFNDHVIVSGLALGCDTIAHHAALRNGAKTIAVLPSGLENISPKRNIKLAKQIVKQGGLLISAYEPEQDVIFRGGRNTYFERNELIAEISDKVLICEAGSGTMNTFSHAKKFGKEILVQMIDNPNNIKIVDDEDGDFLLI